MDKNHWSHKKWHQIFLILLGCFKEYTTHAIFVIFTKDIISNFQFSCQYLKSVLLFEQTVTRTVVFFKGTEVLNKHLIEFGIKTANNDVTLSFSFKISLSSDENEVLTFDCRNWRFDTSKYLM